MSSYKLLHWLPCTHIILAKTCIATTKYDPTTCPEKEVSSDQYIRLRQSLCKEQLVHNSLGLIGSRLYSDQGALNPVQTGLPP